MVETQGSEVAETEAAATLRRLTAAVCSDETGLTAGEVERIPGLIQQSILNNWNPEPWRNPNRRRR